MKLLESLKTSLESLRANKMRSGLTMLGVIIGVGFVILLVSLGSGARTEILKGLQAMGSNLIMVVPFKIDLKTVAEDPMQTGLPSSGMNKFSMRMKDTIGRAIGRPEDVGVTVSRSSYMQVGKRKFFGTITGTDSNNFKISGLETEKGSFFTSADVGAARKVIVIGKTIARSLFGDRDPIGEYITIKGRPFKVVGVQKERGMTMALDQDAFAYIPYTTAASVFGASKPEAITVKARSAEAVPEEMAVIKEALIKEEHLSSDEFSLISQSEAMSFAQNMTRILTYLLGGMAGISLVVGGIGIMNIMLVSVTERTREIGIRKAVGAKTRDILFQFLTEAVTLSVIGGIIGIGLAALGSSMYTWIFDMPTKITLGTVLMAFFFALAVGIFFGVYPARKASLLDPIESLRYE